MTDDDQKKIARDISYVHNELKERFLSFNNFMIEVLQISEDISALLGMNEEMPTEIATALDSMLATAGDRYPSRMLSYIYMDGMVIIGELSPNGQNDFKDEVTDIFDLLVVDITKLVYDITELGCDDAKYQTRVTKLRSTALDKRFTSEQRLGLTRELTKLTIAVEMSDRMESKIYTGSMWDFLKDGFSAIFCGRKT